MTKPDGMTVFIPVFNEQDILEQNIRRLKAYLDRLPFPFEIMIGSNGSFDRTTAILQNMTMEAPWLSFFHLKRKGVGKAFVRGVRKARFNRIVSVDMDLSIDLCFIEKAYHLLSHVHVVVGSKKTGDQKRSLIRMAASQAFICCAKMLLGITYSDYSIAAKAYRTEAILPYLSGIDPHTFYVVLILHNAFHDGKSIVEVPVSCRDLRPSRFNLIHEGFYKFSRLFMLCARERFLPLLTYKFRKIMSR